MQRFSGTAFVAGGRSGGGGVAGLRRSILSKGYDPNERYKRELLRELIERLRDKKYLSEELLAFGSDAQIVDDLLLNTKSPGRMEPWWARG